MGYASAGNANGVREAAQSQASIVWYISLGDLLTLLLCFFICLTPWDQIGNAAQSELNQELEEKPKSVSPFGTSFASKSWWVSKIVAEIPVFEGAEGDADFSRTQDGLRNALARREKVSISLRVCEGAAPRQQLLEKLGALVQEMAGEETPLEFEIVGSCEGAALLTPVTEKVVAGVRISTM